jgi:cellulose synthase (UDP-forming)
VVAVLAVVLGLNYLGWRWAASLNWSAWWIAVPLVVDETYSLIDVALFALTMWRSGPRSGPPVASPDLTVDVFITTFDEPLELVLRTVRGALGIRWPHSTWVLDDGGRPELAEAVTRLGAQYLTRGDEWSGRERHAKAGNLNNALMSTGGEIVLVLDADQVPDPAILERTLGYFDDPAVAFVQTPQTFGNVPAGDPLGSEAPLFYGPVQQGKDGWNAAYFCGSNALLRREALMQLGLTRYVAEIEAAVNRALRSANRVLRKAIAEARDQPDVAAGLLQVALATAEARAALAAGSPVSTATYALQQRVESVSRELVAADLGRLSADLADLGVESLMDADLSLVAAAASPLHALESVRRLLRSIDVDRDDQALPVMPMATISVTEDMATSMRLHALGWRSVYHHEVLAVGLAPEDLRSMLTQRLRWAQGTMQVLLREDPLRQRGLSLAQRLMYFSTMWSYLSGFATITYVLAPVVFLIFGVLPVTTSAMVFLAYFLPFQLANQVLFLVAGRGLSTWRGQQYSLALFPVWIRAVATAVGDVYFGRTLAFAVTPKTRQVARGAWWELRWQIAAAALLAVAMLDGVGRLEQGTGDPIATIVNLGWVVFDLALLSVLLRALRTGVSRRRGAQPAWT